MRIGTCSGKCRAFAGMLLCLLLCVSLLPVKAFAGTQDMLDVKEETALTVQYELGGASFYLYRAADVSADLEFTLTGDFAGYPMEVNGLDGAGWRALAETLAGFAVQDQIRPLRSGVTDEEGSLVWSNLETGLYLVVGEQMEVDSYVYTPMPSLVVLPSRNDAGQWEYDAVIQPKYDREEQPGSDMEKIILMKIWQDHGFEDRRPDSITAELYMDGTLYDTVSLNKENNWRYEWKDLPAGHKWTAAEKDMPDCYSMTCVKEGEYLVITNCYQPETPAETESSSGTESSAEEESSSGSESSAPAGTGGSGGSGNGSGGGGSVLPQTGQLWWPVPILAFAGIAAFTIGWARRRARENEND